MNRRTRLRAFFSMLLLATVAFLGGCATTGVDRSVKTSATIQEVDKEIRKMIVQIDATAESLNALVVPENKDLKKSFDSYTDSLARLESDGKRVNKRAEELKSQSKEYFAEWEKQGDTFTNPEIRKLSDERRGKLAETYARVPAAGAGIKDTYDAYLTDLKEIQRFLSIDLTPKGVEGIAPLATKSVRNLESLKKSLQPVLTALDEIKAELFSGR